MENKGEIFESVIYIVFPICIGWTLLLLSFIKYGEYQNKKFFKNQQKEISEGKIDLKILNEYKSYNE